MDSREKANDLVNRYYYMLPNNGKLNEGINNCDSRYKEAIECAFVTVDEILESNPNYEYWRTYDDETPSAITFWNEVKQWIQKIKLSRQMKLFKNIQPLIEYVIRVFF